MSTLPASEDTLHASSTFPSQTRFLLMTYTRDFRLWDGIFAHWFGTFPGFQRFVSSPRTFWRFSVTWPFRTVIHTRPGILHCLEASCFLFSRDHCPNRDSKSILVKINALHHSYIFLSLHLLNSFVRYLAVVWFGLSEAPWCVNNDVSLIWRTHIAAG